MSYEIVETMPPREEMFCDGSVYVETIQMRRMVLQAEDWSELAQDRDRAAVGKITVAYDLVDTDPDAALRTPMITIAIKGARLDSQEAGDPMFQPDWDHSVSDARVWHYGGSFCMCDEYRTFVKVPVTASVTYAHYRLDEKNMNM